MISTSYSVELFLRFFRKKMVKLGTAATIKPLTLKFCETLKWSETKKLVAIKWRKSKYDKRILKFSVTIQFNSILI